jgi:hypothetical protein
MPGAAATDTAAWQAHLWISLALDGVVVAVIAAAATLAHHVWTRGPNLNRAPPFHIHLVGY